MADGAARACRSEAESENSTVATIHAETLHNGKVSPLLFGNFIELLDDVVPGIWAEMLNDRSLEGVEPMIRRDYFDGTPDFCDRQWDANETWTCDSSQPFNGARCAKLISVEHKPAILSQSGLAVRKDMTYHFSGYLRTAGSPLAVSVILKTLLPDGSWMTLASARLSQVTDSWRKYSVSLTSRGLSDHVVFELQAQGQGQLFADKLSLMPDDAVHGWRRDVVDVVKDMHPSIIRWGGSIIDPGGYRWKNGIGDRDLRTPFRNVAWGRIDPNDVGIDEFCQLCEAVDATPLICVSFSDGAQSAQDLVQYCNGDAASAWGAKRAANGHPAPYRVKYWQVGNEIRGDKPEYLAQIEDFIHSIKQAEPEAQVMSSYPAQKLVDVAGKDLSFLCPHQYKRDMAFCDAELSNLSHMIDTTPGCAHLKIAITEWNVAGGEWGLMRGRQMTLESALIDARHLHVMMRHCDKVAIANRSNLSNSFCGATFETNPSGILKRPSHYVMGLYAKHARPLPLKVESPSNGPDVFACASLDKKAVTLFAVNSKDEPVELKLTSEGFEKPLHLLRAESVCDVQDARQPEIMNHWTAPERVKTVQSEMSHDAVTLPAFSATAIEYGF